MMQEMLVTVDRLLSRYRPLNHAIETLVSRIVPTKTAAACFTNGCRKSRPCKSQGCVMFSYYSDRRCTRFVCNTQCFC